MFYDNFVKLCSRDGVSASAVMKAIGLNKSSATYWKKGSMPSSDTLQKLADYFDVSMDYLLDLPADDKANMDYIEEYVIKTTGKSREEVHKFLIEQKIYDIPFEQYIDALSAADKATLEKFKFVSEAQLRKYLLDDYRHLNRRGRIEAVIRIEEIGEIGRYRRPDVPEQDTPSLDTPAAEKPTEPPENGG